MPAIYAHLRFGQETLRYLPSPFPYLIRHYPEAFLLGTQGPDILFYHQPLKKNELREHGSYLHTLSGKEFFLEQAKKLVEGVRTNDVREVFERHGAHAAYVCGFLCHFTLDAVCHPFIDYNSCYELSHARIESEFDKYLLRADGHPIRGYNTASPIKAIGGAKEAVARALDIPVEEAELSIRTMRKINKLFSFPLGLVHGVCHLGLSIVGMNHKFGDMFLYKQNHPLCDKANEVLWDEFYNALPIAADLIRVYMENLKFFIAQKTLHNSFLDQDFSGNEKMTFESFERPQPQPHPQAHPQAQPQAYPHPNTAPQGNDIPLGYPRPAFSENEPTPSGYPHPHPHTSFDGTQPPPNYPHRPAPSNGTDVPPNYPGAK